MVWKFDQKIQYFHDFPAGVETPSTITTTSSSTSDFCLVNQFFHSYSRTGSVQLKWTSGSCCSRTFAKLPVTQLIVSNHLNVSMQSFGAKSLLFSRTITKTVAPNPKQLSVQLLLKSCGYFESNYMEGGAGCKLPEQSCLLPPTSQVADRDTTSRI